MDGKVNWLYLDLNSFFASCEQQDRPELRGKPIAVIPVMTDRTSVIAASYPAKAFGIKTGTKVGDAKKMCPGLHLVLASHRRYVEYHHQIIEVVETCAPVWGVMSIDEIAIQLTGSHSNLEKAIRLSQQIKTKIQENVGVAMTSSIGLAPNRYLAKVAADMKKPDGLTYILKHELPQKLFSLQLRDLPGIGHRTEARLKSLGVHSIEQLCEKTERDLQHGLWKSIWGSRMWQWLRGEEVDLVKNETQSLGHQHVLSPAMRNFNGSWIVAQRLLVKAAVRLRKNGFLTRRISLHVKIMNGPSFEKSVRIDETQDTFALMKYMKDMWRELPRNMRPIRVGVTLSEVKSEEMQQLSLFEDGHRPLLNRAIDRLNAKYGRDAVHLGSLHEHIEKATTKIAFQRIPDLDEL